MPSFSVEIEENWGAEGSACGLLFVCPYSELLPGLGSMLVEEYFTKSDYENIPTIPVISREAFYTDDMHSKLYINKYWPAIITGGRSLIGRQNRGPSHYEIMIRERSTGDSSFMASLVKGSELSRNIELLEQMHLTVGKITVAGGIVTVESELEKIIEQEILLEAASKLQLP